MKHIHDVLAEHPFFQGLAKADLEFIAGCGSNVAFRAGEEIAREGSPADHFYVIRKGRVAIETYAAGRGAIPVQTVDDGEILGWSWLFEPYEWAFDVRALQDVRAIALDGRCLRGKCEANHELGYELMKRFARIMTRRLEATRMQLLDVYGKEAS